MVDKRNERIDDEHRDRVEDRGRQNDERNRRRPRERSPKYIEDERHDQCRKNARNRSDQKWQKYACSPETGPHTSRDNRHDSESNHRCSKGRRRQDVQGETSDHGQPHALFNPTPNTPGDDDEENQIDLDVENREARQERRLKNRGDDHREDSGYKPDHDLPSGTSSGA